MGKRLNVCFFSGDITRSGGTERVSSLVAKQLVKNEDMEICVLSLWEENKHVFFALHSEVHRYTLFDNPVNGKNILKYIMRIKKFVKEQQIDILVDIDGILDIYSIPAVKGTKCKIISWEQFNYYQNPDGNLRKITRKLAAKKADAIVVLTKEDESYYKENLKIKHIIRHIYNPIILNKSEHSYDKDSKTIISAGRITYQKGFDLLVDVAEIVLKKYPDWEWILVGDGEDRLLIETKIKEKGLEGKLILLGNVNNIDEYYEKSSMYVLTSRFEGFGLVLTEAKAHHLPCVSFKCPAGPAEIIINKNNGFLIENFSVNDMAEKICKLISDKNLRVEFSRKALQDTEKFKIEEIEKQWLGLFEELNHEK